MKINLNRESPFSAGSIRGDDCGYVAFHAPRYAYLLRLLSEYDVTANSTLLDIGVSRLTSLMHEKFGVCVDSLGFGTDESAANGSRHFGFDLNLTQDRKCWRQDIPKYEFVIMAEVIEHLYTAPQLVLPFIKTLLVEGGVLMIQTPNAASLSKRIRLLRGYNPYEMLRVDQTNPGHFREYTVAELYQLAKETGFQVELCQTFSYFDARFARHEYGREKPEPVVGSIKNLIASCLPKSMQPGITMVWRNL